MIELPFQIGRKTKWVHGINDNTTCKDIVLSILRTEGLILQGEERSEDKVREDGAGGSKREKYKEEDVHKHFALVEKWREVEKVLKPSTLILKIWRAWGEEGADVSFIVKKIKQRKQKEDQQATPKVRRKNSRSGKGQTKVDTLHPRGLFKTQRQLHNNIEDILKHIITQGESVKQHLCKLQDGEDNQRLERLLEDIRNLSETKLPQTKPNLLCSDEANPEHSNDSGVGGEDGVSGEDNIGVDEVNKEDEYVGTETPEITSLQSFSDLGDMYPNPGDLYPNPPTRGFILHASPVQVIGPSPPPPYSNHNQITPQPPPRTITNHQVNKGPIMSNYGSVQLVQQQQQSLGKVCSKSAEQHHVGVIQNDGLSTTQPRHVPFADFTQRSQNFVSHPSQNTRHVTGPGLPNFPSTSSSQLYSDNMVHHMNHMKRISEETTCTSANNNGSSTSRQVKSTNAATNFLCSAQDAANYLHVADRSSSNSNKSLQHSRTLPSLEPCYEEQDGDLEFVNLSDSLSSYTDSSSQTVIRRPVRGHDRSFDPVHGHDRSFDPVRGHEMSFDPVRGLDQSFDSSTSSIQPQNRNNAFNNNNNNSITRSKDETVNFKTDATTMRNKVSQHLHQQQTMSTSDATTNHSQQQNQLEAKKSANGEVVATSESSTLGIKQPGTSTPGVKQPGLPLSPPPSDPMFYEWMDMYEKLHRLNRILETKEEQVIALSYELSAHDSEKEQKNGGENNGGQVRYDTPPPCFNTDVVKFREINARLMQEITLNGSFLSEMKAKNEERKRLVSQLEFDVNVVEREGKRLEADLNKVKTLTISADVHRSQEDDDLSTHRLNLQETLSSLTSSTHQPSTTTKPSQSSPSCSTTSDVASSTTSSKSVKTVRFSDADHSAITISTSLNTSTDFTSESITSSLSMGTKTTRIFNSNDTTQLNHSSKTASSNCNSRPKSILKTEAAESDCSSDTGLSSLSVSSDEGTYALTTLV